MPQATISTAPSNADAGRFKGRILSRRPLMSRYVTQKIAIATTSRCETLAISNFRSKTLSQIHAALRSRAKLLNFRADTRKFLDHNALSCEIRRGTKHKTRWPRGSCTFLNSNFEFRISELTRFACLRAKDTPSSTAQVYDLIFR